MYLPAHFEEQRPEVLHTLLRTHPLGLLVRQNEQGLCADSIPFIHDPEPTPWGSLRGHVARANPLWRESDGSPVLVVFQGPQAYVSPGWYPTKAETGKVVPTWNYVMVQARGTLRVVDDAAWLHALVTRLTDTHEARSARPWAVADAPGSYIDAMLRAIVGIEIPLEALTGKWKVSQNRNTADRDGVALGLDERPGDETTAMAHQVRTPGGG